jgi:alpha-beta hydrolase superfamily lysophospholipase
VLVLPAVGYAYWSAYATLRTVAERLAEAGHTVLRIDYDGTGDSAGEQTEPDRLAAWRRSAAAGIEELRSLGCSRVAIVGVQLGAALALVDGATWGVDAVAAWAPVVNGRRFTRQVRLVSTEVPTDAGWPDGTLLQAGVTFRADTLADIATLDVTAVRAAPPRVLLLGSGLEPVAEALRSAGSEVAVVDDTDGHLALEQAAEDATVPEAAVTALCDFVGPAHADTTVAPVPSEQVTLHWQGGELAERIALLGAHRLVTVVTEPVTVTPDTTVVFLNAGSEPHVGSGRAWVEYARGLALRGYRVVRADFRGWGESPDGGFAPGRPYDAHTLDDVADLVEALRAASAGRIVLVGLCAGAWVALRAALRVDIGGVIALNPQLYWQPGDPVEALMSQTRERRTPERARIEKWQRRRVWSLLDILGQRPWAGRWLDDLMARPVTVSFVFSEHDDGLEYLETRLGRRLGRARRAGLRVREIPGIDHSAHRAWLRPLVIEAIAEELDRR